MDQTAALADLRVLDLTDAIGAYATKLMADLGAEVIRVEPPTGDPMRGTGPFVDDAPGPDRSLAFLHFNTNKRSVTLDVGTPAGRALLDRLLETSDLLVESFTPAELEELSLEHEATRRLNPSLIQVSVTPFGLTGPHRNFRGSDLIGQAMGGLMALTGFSDDPPVRVAASQGYHQASLHAAVGAMAAVARRDLTGEGAHVEVSMQDAIALATLQTGNLNFYTQHGVVPRRVGNGGVSRIFHDDGSQTAARPTYYQCAEGWVNFAYRAVGWEQILDWLDSLGVTHDLRNERYQDPATRPQHLDHIYDVISACLATQRAEDVYHSAQQHDLVCMPVRTIDGLASDEQLEDRGFLVTLEHDDLARSITYPGAPYVLSETPWQVVRHAPMVGEYNREIYVGELGLSEGEFAQQQSAGVL